MGEKELRVVSGRLVVLKESQEGGLHGRDGKGEVRGIEADRVEEMWGVEAEDIQADSGASSSAAGEASLV
jgi:hypothetical protein